MQLGKNLTVINTILRKEGQNMKLFFKTKVNANGNTKGLILDTEEKTAVYGYGLTCWSYDTSKPTATTRSALLEILKACKSDGYTIIER